MIAITVIGWIAMCGAGFSALWQHSSLPGETVSGTPAWPSSSQLQRDPDKPTLVLFAHPRCPCTRASLRELERLMGRVGSLVTAAVVFTGAPDRRLDWFQTDQVRHAEMIPGVQVVADSAGDEAGRFQARTSGEARLYSRTGGLLFQGGVTFSRGHEGSNDGVTALEALILDGTASLSQTPVYGCPLQSPGAALPQEPAE